MKLCENYGFKEGEFTFSQQICKEIHCPDCSAVNCQVCLSRMSNSGSLKESPPKVLAKCFLYKFIKG